MPPRRTNITLTNPVTVACVHCRNLKLRCSAIRPCERCVTAGKASECTDHVHAQRGRRPKSHRSNNNQPLTNDVLNTNNDKNDNNENGSNQFVLLHNDGIHQELNKNCDHIGNDVENKQTVQNNILQIEPKIGNNDINYSTNEHLCAPKSLQFSTTPISSSTMMASPIIAPSHISFTPITPPVIHNSLQTNDKNNNNPNMNQNNTISQHFPPITTTTATTAIKTPHSQPIHPTHSKLQLNIPMLGSNQVKQPNSPGLSDIPLSLPGLSLHTNFQTNFQNNHQNNHQNKTNNNSALTIPKNQPTATSPSLNLSIRIPGAATSIYPNPPPAAPHHHNNSFDSALQRTNTNPPHTFSLTNHRPAPQPFSLTNHHPQPRPHTQTQPLQSQSSKPTLISQFTIDFQSSTRPPLFHLPHSPQNCVTNQPIHNPTQQSNLPSQSHFQKLSLQTNPKPQQLPKPHEQPVQYLNNNSLNHQPPPPHPPLPSVAPLPHSTTIMPVASSNSSIIHTNVPFQYRNYLLFSDNIDNNTDSDDIVGVGGPDIINSPAGVYLPHGKMNTFYQALLDNISIIPPIHATVLSPTNNINVNCMEINPNGDTFCGKSILCNSNNQHNNLTHNPNYQNNNLSTLSPNHLQYSPFNTQNNNLNMVSKPNPPQQSSLLTHLTSQTQPNQAKNTTQQHRIYPEQIQNLPKRVPKPNHNVSNTAHTNNNPAHTTMGYSEPPKRPLMTIIEKDSPYAPPSTSPHPNVPFNTKSMSPSLKLPSSSVQSQNTQNSISSLSLVTTTTTTTSTSPLKRPFQEPEPTISLFNLDLVIPTMETTVTDTDHINHLIAGGHQINHLGDIDINRMIAFGKQLAFGGFLQDDDCNGENFSSIGLNLNTNTMNIDTPMGIDLTHSNHHFHETQREEKLEIMLNDNTTNIRQEYQFNSVLPSGLSPSPAHSNVQSPAA